VSFGLLTCGIFGGIGGYAPSHIGRLRLPSAYWLVIIATIFALPFVFHFTRNIRLDRNLGELSYPIYLGHLLVLKLVQKDLSTQKEYIPMAVLVVRLFIAVLMWRGIEVPVTGWRHRRFEGIK
jgi:peptidoglycan/LPS O-acetylase OafA/YrhL